jgi:hypothetical protein
MRPWPASGLGTDDGLHGLPAGGGPDHRGLDGDYKSSARLSRPSYSLRVGDDVIEFKRFDPLGTLLGWGADLHAYLGTRRTIPRMSAATSRADHRGGTLGHSGEHPVQDLAHLAQATSRSSLQREGGPERQGWGRYLQSFATRFVPAAGIQRSIGRGFRRRPEASGFIEGSSSSPSGPLSSPSSGTASSAARCRWRAATACSASRPGRGRRNGRSAPRRAGPAELRHRQAQTVLPRGQAQLVAVQPLPRAQGPGGPQGLHRAHPRGVPRELIKLPEYQALPRAGKVQAIRDEMRGFTSKASAACPRGPRAGPPCGGQPGLGQGAPGRHRSPRSTGRRKSSSSSSASPATRSPTVTQ